MKTKEILRKKIIVSAAMGIMAVAVAAPYSMVSAAAAVPGKTPVPIVQKDKAQPGQDIQKKDSQKKDIQKKDDKTGRNDGKENVRAQHDAKKDNGNVKTNDKSGVKKDAAHDRQKEDRPDKKDMPKRS